MTIRDLVKTPWALRLDLESRPLGAASPTPRVATGDLAYDARIAPFLVFVNGIPRRDEPSVRLRPLIMPAEIKADSELPFRTPALN
jgi:hypothetical protein